MSSSVRLTGRETLYQDPYLTVEQQSFEGDGQSVQYYVKREPEFAVVGAVTTDGQIIMVRQFRPGPGKYTFDVPGGMIDEGQTPMEAAAAELLEETGYEGELEAVTTTYVTAYSTAKKHIFLARNCRKVAEPEGEENVIGEPLLVSSDRFMEIMGSGEMLDLDCMLLLARDLGLEDR